MVVVAEDAVVERGHQKTAASEEKVDLCQTKRVSVYVDEDVRGLRKPKMTFIALTEGSD